jgi:hypothetical protein
MLFGIKDKSDNPIGTVEDGGEIKDMKGNHLGQWDSDGDLFNSSGNLVTRRSRDVSNASDAFVLVGGH